MVLNISKIILKYCYYQNAVRRQWHLFQSKIYRQCSFKQFIGWSAALLPKQHQPHFASKNVQVYLFLDAAQKGR